MKCCRIDWSSVLGTRNSPRTYRWTPSRCLNALKRRLDKKKLSKNSMYSCEIAIEITPLMWREFTATNHRVGQLAPPERQTSYSQGEQTHNAQDVVAINI